MSDDLNQSSATPPAPEPGSDAGDASRDAAANDATEASKEPVVADVTSDEMDALIEAAGDGAAGAVSNEAAQASSAVAVAQGAQEPDLPTFDATDPIVDPKRVTMLNDVKLRVKIELGRTRMLVEDVLKLGDGSVVELDKLAGDPVDVYVNDRLVARGEVLVLNDNFCVRICDVVSNDPHRVSA